MRPTVLFFLAFSDQCSPAIGAGYGKTGNSGPVGSFIAAMRTGAKTLLFRTRDRDGPLLPPCQYLLIDMFGAGRSAIQALGRSFSGVMENDGAIRAPVPLPVKFHIAPFDNDGASLGKGPGDLLQAAAVDPGECRS